MKKIFFINGTMGSGKTTISEELHKILPRNVYLDGDWCWKMNPFVVNDTTKSMVIKNINFLLNSYISSKQFDNIIFCWVMDEQKIIDNVLEGLDLYGYELKVVTLILSPEKLKERIIKDILEGKRQEESISRSIDKLLKYDSINSIKINVENKSPFEIAKIISQM